MATFKIVVDSASDLTNDYLKDTGIAFAVCPLTITVGGVEFVDDDALKVEHLLNSLKNANVKTSSSCPSPGVFLQAYEGADYVFCVTLSSKLSGSFNAAFLASTMSENKVHVIDSKLVGGAERLIVDQLVSLIKEGLSYEEIVHAIDQKVKEQKLLFVLQKFDNLVRNGRMSKIAQTIATFLHIKPLCEGVDGEIKVVAKIRTLKNALQALVEAIGKDVQALKGRTCVVSHCDDEKTAEALAETIRKTYPFKEVHISRMRGLTSYYALEKGIIVSY